MGSAVQQTVPTGSLLICAIVSAVEETEERGDRHHKKKTMCARRTALIYSQFGASQDHRNTTHNNTFARKRVYFRAYGEMRSQSQSTTRIQISSRTRKRGRRTVRAMRHTDCTQTNLYSVCGAGVRRRTRARAFDNTQRTHTLTRLSYRRACECTVNTPSSV